MRRFILLILLPFLISCAPKIIPKGAPLPSYKKATLPELIEKINERNQRIHSLIASLRIEFKPAPSAKFLACSARMLLMKPNKIRLKGYKPLLPTFFLLVSDGESYWFAIPSRKKVYTGRADIPSPLKVLSSGTGTEEMVRLKPKAIIDALLLDKIQLGENKYAFLDILPNFYIINVVKKDSDGLHSERRIWIERKELTIEHHQLFDERGRLVSEVYFRNYRDFGAILFPKLVFIKRPFERVNLRLTFGNIKVNEEISPDAFNYQVPPDMEIVKEER